MSVLAAAEPVLAVMFDCGGRPLTLYGANLSPHQRQTLLEGEPSCLPIASVREYLGRLQTHQAAAKDCQRVSGCSPVLAETAVDWLLSPVPAMAGKVEFVMAVAYPAGSFAVQSVALGGGVPSAYGHRAVQLSQTTRNIRRTLDLETIWQQTVDGLGEVFAAERVMVYGYQPGVESVVAAAEYRRSVALPSLEPRSHRLSEVDYLRRAIATAEPVTLEAAGDDGTSLLAVATRYQDRPNGLIVMHVHQGEWTAHDLDLISELAEQVGTAVAHARRFGESHALAVKLQQANASLMEKHRQLEEAKHQAEEAREQAEEASRLKSEFLANTSHELRTPLNGMIGFLRLVLDGMADDPEEQEEFIKEAHKSALHLLELINDVLDIAKIEAGKMQIDMGPVNLKQLFEAVTSFTRPMAEQKGLELQVQLPSTRDAIILNGNYQRLLQVMLNLLNNAIKFTPAGSVTVSAEIKPQKVEFQGNTWPGFVKVSVADTGIGVSLEKQDRLFQTFSQVDGERTRQYGGTGLGLAISQKLVEAMGGVVQFISMGEGLGSTVTFTALLYQEPVITSAEPVELV